MSRFARLQGRLQILFFIQKGVPQMPTKAEMYRQMADHATQNLTAQIKDWSRFLVLAGQFYKYRFMDQVMIYTQRPAATACARAARPPPRHHLQPLLLCQSSAPLSLLRSSEPRRCGTSSRTPTPSPRAREHHHL